MVTINDASHESDQSLLADFIALVDIISIIPHLLNCILQLVHGASDVLKKISDLCLKLGHHRMELFDFLGCLNYIRAHANSIRDACFVGIGGLGLVCIGPVCMSLG